MALNYTGWVEGSTGRVDFRGFAGVRLGERARNMDGYNPSRLGTQSEHLPHPGLRVEKTMTTFDEREKGFEKKFAHDADLKFKAESRRNKMMAEWAAGKLGITGAAVDDYVKAVRKADLAEKGDDDVVRKLKADFDAKSIKISDTDLHKQMGEFLAQAVADIEGKK